MPNPPASPSTTTKEANELQAIPHLASMEGEDELWNVRISKINQEIEEEQARVATRKYSEYQADIYNAQTSELFSALVRTVKERLTALQRLDNRWNANLRRRLGEARSQELIKESSGQAMQDKIVLAMEQMAMWLDLEEPPNESDVRRMLSCTPDRPHTASTPRAQPPRTECSSLPTPPAPERAGPSGLKRTTEGSEGPSRLRSTGDNDVSLTNLLPMPSSK